MRLWFFGPDMKDSGSVGVDPPLPIVTVDRLGFLILRKMVGSSAQGDDRLRVGKSHQRGQAKTSHARRRSGQKLVLAAAQRTPSHSHARGWSSWPRCMGFCGQRPAAAQHALPPDALGGALNDHFSFCEAVRVTTLTRGDGRR